MSLLVVMGSGETAPTMVKVHREVLARAKAATGGPAVMLDTPFGFQMNADDLVARTRTYFAESVGTPVEVARWRRADQPVVAAEQSLALLHRASWVFAGPGSPTYTLRQWVDTPVPSALLDVVARGGTLVFGSAAACTLGTRTIPVYEIYKVGEEPCWAAGLNLFGRLTGIDCVVVPHYDNAEGGGHDTRFCYLGEQRLVALEADLPGPVGVLGVDEHTALVIDLEARTAQVAGNGLVTVRRPDGSRTFPAGTLLRLDELGALLRGESAAAAAEAGTAGTTGTTGPAPAAPTDPVADEAVSTSLADDTARARERFDVAIAAGDVDGCVRAILDLESAIVAWSTDTLQSDQSDAAHRTLRALVVRLGDLARTGARDPAEAIAPLVEALLELRTRARAGKDFEASDLVRDRLVAAGVEVRDTPSGVTWLLREG